jgi:hypothetical protein
MQYFFDSVIKPHVLKNNCTTVCEIGVRAGENTDKLLTIPSLAELVLVDPCSYGYLNQKYARVDRVRILKGFSLDILSTLSGRSFDLFLIDGDHNWYTVFNELVLIEENRLLADNGVIFLHDVGFPYGRRDAYYFPENIPAEFRHPYAKKGIEPGRETLSDVSTFNSHLNNAIEEGGPKNGVATAAEDFVEAYEDKYTFSVVDGRQHGLGIIERKAVIGSLGQPPVGPIALLFVKAAPPSLCAKDTNPETFIRQNAIDGAGALA